MMSGGIDGLRVLLVVWRVEFEQCVEQERCMSGGRTSSK